MYYPHQGSGVTDQALYLLRQILEQMVARKQERERQARAAQEAAEQARRDRTQEELLALLRQQQQQQRQQDQQPHQAEPPRPGLTVTDKVALGAVGAVVAAGIGARLVDPDRPASRPPVALSDTELRESHALLDQMAGHPETRAFVATLREHMADPSADTRRAVGDAALRLDTTVAYAPVGRFALLCAQQVLDGEAVRPILNYVAAGQYAQDPQFHEIVAGHRGPEGAWYAQLAGLAGEPPYDQRSEALRLDVQQRLHTLDRTPTSGVGLDADDLAAADRALLDRAGTPQSKAFALALDRYLDDPSDAHRALVQSRALELATTDDPVANRFALTTAHQVATGADVTPALNYIAAWEHTRGGVSDLLIEAYPDAAPVLHAGRELAGQPPHDRSLTELRAHAERAQGIALDPRSAPAPDAARAPAAAQHQDFARTRTIAPGALGR